MINHCWFPLTFLECAETRTSVSTGRLISDHVFFVDIDESSSVFQLSHSIDWMAGAMERVKMNDPKKPRPKSELSPPTSNPNV